MQVLEELTKVSPILIFVMKIILLLLLSIYQILPKFVTIFDRDG